MSKKIIVVVSSMDRGGAQRVITALSNQWAAQGIDVQILTLLGEGCGYSLDPKVEVTSLYQVGKSRRAQLLHWAHGIRSIVKDEGADTVLSFFPKVSIIAWFSVLGLKCRFVASERNDPRYDGRSGLVHKLSSFVYKKADAIIFQTSLVKELYPGCKPERTYVIANPLSFDVDLERKREVKRGCIVSAGKMYPQKNQALLIRAFAKVCESMKGLTLTIYGKGILRDELLALAEREGVSDRVEFPGNVDDLIDRISDAELFVLSSDYEGFSSALLEALALGVPCVTTDVAGARDMIEDRKDGLIVPTGDVELLAEAMEQLLRDEEMQSRFSERSRQRAFRYNNVGYIVERWNKACAL